MKPYISERLVWALADTPTVTYFRGRPLSTCSTGEIVTAVKLLRTHAADIQTVDAILNEATVRGILPDAMWLLAS